jgi:hypothetical protein
MNQLDDELQARKIKYYIFDCIVLVSIAYALYTYVWPIIQFFI